MDSEANAAWTTWLAANRHPDDAEADIAQAKQSFLVAWAASWTEGTSRGIVYQALFAGWRRDVA